jgi:hypothetical protein
MPTKRPFKIPSTTNESPDLISQVESELLNTTSSESAPPKKQISRSMKYSHHYRTIVITDLTDLIRKFTDHPFGLLEGLDQAVE